MTTLVIVLLVLFLLGGGGVGIFSLARVAPGGKFTWPRPQYGCWLHQKGDLDPRRENTGNSFSEKFSKEKRRNQMKTSTKGSDRRQVS